MSGIDTCTTGTRHGRRRDRCAAFRPDALAAIMTLALCAAALITICAADAFAAGTPAGTTITSRAKAMYSTAGGARTDTSYSQFVTVTVQQKAAVNILPAAGSQIAAGSGATADFAHTVVNSGNGPDRFQLAAASASGWSAAVYSDANGDGILQSEELAAGAVSQTPSLAADASYRIILRVTVPSGVPVDGRTDTTRVRAQSMFASSVAAEGIDRTTIQGASMTGELTVTDPFPSEGDNVTFVGVFTNSGSLRAENIVISDLIAPGFTYVSATGGTVNSTLNPVTWSIGALEPGQRTTVLLTVQINAGVPSGTILKNQMRAAYTAASAAYAAETNIASVQVMTGTVQDNGITITPFAAASSGEAKDTIVYRYRITNTGTTKQGMKLRASSSQKLAWSVYKDANNDLRFDAADRLLFGPGSLPDAIVDSVASGDSVRIFAVTVLPRMKKSADILRLTASFVPGAVSDSAAVITTIDAPDVAASLTVSPGNHSAGSELTYTIRYSNDGSAAVDNFSVVDAAPGFTEYVSNSVSVDGVSVQDDQGAVKLSVNERQETVITVTVGRLHANNSGTVAFKVAVPSELHTQPPPGTRIFNQAKIIYTYRSFPADTALTNIASFVVMGAPSSISIATQRDYLFGIENQDSTLVTVTVEDTVHNVLQDAVDVRCMTSFGTFTNGSGTTLIRLANGKAVTYLRSGTVQNDRITATITASAQRSPGDSIAASARVVNYSGAVMGIVLNGPDLVPYRGALARVTDASNSIAGADTTKENGAFFIALDKRPTMYHLQISVTDAFGDTLSSSAEIDASKFPRPAVSIPNVIAGRLQYRGMMKPIPSAGVTVYLDSIARQSASGRSGARTASTSSWRVQERTTDAKGRFTFGGLPPALYRLSIDSTKFPNYSGEQFIADTVAGTFAVNVNIGVQLDSLIQMRVNAAHSASAGDTLRYSVAAVNAGNIPRFNAAVIDTLPTNVKFVSLEQGTFAAASYDSVQKIVRWTIDTLGMKAADSASFLVALPGNIRDSTTITNTAWFSRAGEALTARGTAATLVRSQAIMRFSTFFSGRDSVAAGDSVVKVYTYRNSGTDSLRGVTIVDTLYRAGRSTFAFLSKADEKRAAISDSVITIAVGAIAPQRADTIMLRIVTDRGLAPGSQIRSSTRFMKNGNTIDSVTSILPIIDKSNLASLLKVMKTANKKSAEIGDVVTYQIQMTNVFTGPLHGVGVYDVMPHAFTYVKRSARFNGRPLEPLQDPSAHSLTWTPADTIGGSGAATLVYQLALGADALESEGLNTVYAAGETQDGLRLVSEPSQWQVTVRPGVFTEKGLIIGKVFYDDNRNMFQEDGESGIKDVELWMEDGTRITTGDDGKYSVPEMKPGQHVLRVNERSLPAGTELLGGANDFAKDPVSRFVRVTSSGIAKANFFVKRMQRDSTARTRATGLDSTSTMSKKGAPLQK